MSTSIICLKKIALGSSRDINSFMDYVISLKSQSKIAEIFESAILLSNSLPLQRELKEKLIQFITHRRKNMYWLYLQHKVERFEQDMLTYDEYLREVIRQEQFRSKQKSFFKKVAQLFAPNPVRINFGSYPLSSVQINEIKRKLRSPDIPYSTMIKLTAWMKYTVEDQIYNLMMESQKMKMFPEYHKSEHQLENTFDQEETSLHTD